MLEKELYPIVANYFKENGFLLDGEVNDVDILCIKDEVTVAVELKLELNFKVIIQASKRQKLFDLVYIGIKTPKSLKSNIFKDKIYLLKRLGIGLIIINPISNTLSIHSDPVESNINIYKSRNKEKKESIILELKERKYKNNIGGVNKVKTITKYRQDCLIVLDTLKTNGAMSGKNIKKITGVEKATSIMSLNYYGWFVKINRGVYDISKFGETEFLNYEKIIKEIKKTMLVK